jgi:molybdopterin/thiamine biosynthesis adenylyltransferase
MLDPVFARNPKEAERLQEKNLAIIGCGSGGSALADMGVRSGFGVFTLVDPEALAPENIGRHILHRDSVGSSKARGVQRAIEAVNPSAKVESIEGKFTDLAVKPDLLVVATDSFSCESLVNDYSLREGVPAVYGGCWGEASVGEILYVVPGKTPCFECFAGFRRQTAEVPADARKYTDPEFDATRLPGQAGLWANILVITGVMFQIILGLVDPESERRQLIDFEHTLFLVNVSKYDSDLQPLAVTFGKVRKGCAICDESKLAELGSGFRNDPQGVRR